MQCSRRGFIVYPAPFTTMTASSASLRESRQFESRASRHTNLTFFRTWCSNGAVPFIIVPSSRGRLFKATLKQTNSRKRKVDGRTLLAVRRAKEQKKKSCMVTTVLPVLSRPVRAQIMKVCGPVSRIGGRRQHNTWFLWPPVRLQIGVKVTETSFTTRKNVCRDV